MSRVGGRGLLGNSVAVGVILTGVGAALFGEIWMFLLLSRVNSQAVEWMSAPISLGLDALSIAGFIPFVAIIAAGICSLAARMLSPITKTLQADS